MILQRADAARLLDTYWSSYNQAGQQNAKSKAGRTSQRTYWSEVPNWLEASGDVDCWAEARKGLAMCYWREGAFDEARLTLSDLLERVEQVIGALQAMMDVALVERSSGNTQKALEIYYSTATLSKHQSAFLQALFHNGFALALKANSADRRRN